MINRVIKGCGHYIPKNKVTNFDFEKRIDTSNEWIKSRTGIESRYFSHDENTSFLAYKASLSAIKDANINKEEIDLIIVATCTPDNLTPSCSCLLQEKLGLNDKDVMAFDINAACSGFLYGLHIASKMLYEYKCALVVGSEVLSKVINYNDKNTSVLFGDGAGAVIMKREDTNKHMYFYANSIGDSNGYLTIKGSDLTQNFVNGNFKISPISMNGNEVFRFAVNAMAKSTSEILKKANKNIEDVDLIIPHQANIRIINHVIKKEKINKDKVFINLNKYGNTSAASVAIALSEAKEKGLIKEGNSILLVGFGAGFTYASAYIEM